MIIKFHHQLRQWDSLEVDVDDITVGLSASIFSASPAIVSAESEALISPSSLSFELPTFSSWQLKVSSLPEGASSRRGSMNDSVDDVNVCV